MASVSGGQPPQAPLKWHKPEAVLLRLETRSHIAAVSESRSSEHDPNNLMDMLCLPCRKGPRVQGRGGELAEFRCLLQVEDKPVGLSCEAEKSERLEA